MDYSKFYRQLYKPVEERIGPVDPAGIAAIVGFDVGGPVGLCTVGRGRDQFVTYVTNELAVREDQQFGTTGPFELMITCDNQAWALKILTVIGQMSLDDVIKPGDTIDIRQVAGRGCWLQGLVIEEFARVSIDGRFYGLLRLHGLTGAELQFAREFGSERVLGYLRKAGVFPRTTVRLRESVGLGK
jgi:hypothetical protein